jgi:hypothetical protein
MANDPKSDLNLGGSRTSYVITDLKSGIAAMRQETALLKQEWSSVVQTMGTGVARMSGGGFGGQSSNQVAPNPVFHIPGQDNNGGGSGGNNQLFALPGGSGGGGGGNGPTVIAGGGSYWERHGAAGSNLSNAAVPGGGVLYGAGLALGSANSTSDMVQTQLLLTRAYANMPITGSTLFNSGQMTATGVSNPLLETAMARINGNKANQNLVAGYNYANDTMMRFAAAGAMNDKMDAINALTAAQSYGITSPNFLMGAGGDFNGSVAQGVANVSNLAPGIGGTGAMRAYGVMQQGKNVNMLKGVGIQIRDANGNLKPPDQIIDDLWKKICRDYSGAYGGNKSPSERELLIAFQPGNSMDAMIGNLFGDDAMVYTLVKNGLIFKARQTASGGSTAINAANALEANMTTSAVQSFNYGNSIATQGLGMTASTGAAGFYATKMTLTDMGNAANQNPVSAAAIKMMNGLAAVLQTLGSAGNGIGGKFMGLLANLAGAKAEGGPTNAANTYLVGEKGPELFVPNVNGTIIPNNALPLNYKGARAGGGQVSINDFSTDILNKLGAPVTSENLAGLADWANWEGGVINGIANAKQKNPASYNPWDTTWNMPGATSINSVGVRAYANLSDGETATLNTLRQANMKPIRDVLMSGNATIDEIEAAIASTPWGTKFGLTSSGASSNDTAGSTLADLSSQISDALTQQFGGQYAQAFLNYLGQDAFGAGALLATPSGSTTTSGTSTSGGTGTTNNYGGVTFNLNIPGADPQQIKGIIDDYLSQLKSGSVVATQ